ncbi:hypothetical protein WUBG_13220, partial [Wuchereria bancrofti]
MTMEPLKCFWKVDIERFTFITQFYVSLLQVRRPGALHGGPRAIKKAINLLTILGRASQAVDLYLKKRSTV